MAKRAFIDAGHSGVGKGLDCGAVGNGLYESDITLAVSKKVEHHLKRHGVEVMLSRGGSNKEVSLMERTNMANRWKADCFVSIHCNAATPSAYGIETFCYKFAYRKLADKVHGRLLGDKSLYYTNRGVKQGDFHVIRESKMDACLVEMAFISNGRDAQLLKNKQSEYAVAIVKGILDYLGIAWIDEGANPIKPPTHPTEELYRVRKSWSDSNSQLGAYKILDSAKANCPSGYSVFDSKGNSVYRNSGSQPPVTPPVPSKAKVDVFYKFDNLPWVKNLEDNAGLNRVSAKNLYAYPSKGEVLFRVSPVNGNYYSWVQNYKTASGNYDFAGNGVPIDRIQMKLRGLVGYSIRYRVRLVNGTLLPWVVNDADFAGIRGQAISNIEVEIF